MGAEQEKECAALSDEVTVAMSDSGAFKAVADLHGDAIDQLLAIAIVLTM